MGRKEKSRKKAKKKEYHISLVHSLLSRILFLVTLAILIAAVPTSVIAIRSYKSNVTDTAKDYLLDVAKAYGATLGEHVQITGASSALGRASLMETFSGVEVSGFETAYLYVVGADGVILYHPELEMLGTSVEEPAVISLVDAIQTEKEVDASGVALSELGGRNKYVGYQMNANRDYILVVTVEEAEVTGKIVRVERIIIGIIAVSALFVYLLGILISRRNIVLPVRTLVGCVQELGKLNLIESEKLRKISGQKDEIGLIGKTIEGLIEDLRKTVVVIKDEATELRKSSEEFIDGFQNISVSIATVNTSVSEINDGSRLHASETASAGDQVADIGIVIDKNTSIIQTLDSASKEMLETSREMKQTLRDLTTVSEHSVRNIRMVEEQTHTTNASVEKIKEAVAMIESIAEQTNLLSLNASIEAARAGNAGRGFAVVAEEIRKLAESSAESALEIGESVKELIENSQVSVEKMEKVHQDIERQGEKISSTIKEFDRLEQNMEGVSDVAEDIFMQNQNLNGKKESLSGSVCQLSAISEENAANTQETSEHMLRLRDAIDQCSERADRLLMLSGRLNQVAERFSL